MRRFLAAMSLFLLGASPQFAGPPSMTYDVNCATQFVVLTCDPVGSLWPSTMHVYWNATPTIDLTKYWATEARGVQKHTWRLKSGTWYRAKFAVKEWPEPLWTHWWLCP
jgi:hypothetical protein